MLERQPLAMLNLNQQCRTFWALATNMIVAFRLGNAQEQPPNFRVARRIWPNRPSAAPRGKRCRIRLGYILSSATDIANLPASLAIRKIQWNTCPTASARL